MKKTLERIRMELSEAEKSEATVEKYLRDAERFIAYVIDHSRAGSDEQGSSKPNSEEHCGRIFDAEKMISKDIVVAYKQNLIVKGYKPSTVNGMLAGVRALLKILDKDDISIKNLRIQKQNFANNECVLKRDEYMTLIRYGEEHVRGRKIALIMETICSTGIRVSELEFFTVEAVMSGVISVRLKGKERRVLITKKLRNKLIDYAEENGLETGCIFRNKYGRPLHRSQIWHKMKKMCADVGIDERKVFPHNLRKLFAREFYEVNNDIAKLADILGHSSIDTTRIYIMTSAKEHISQLEKLELVT